MQETLNYLGVKFDKKLDLVEHATMIRAKMLQIANKITSIAYRTYGRKSTLTEKIIKSAVMYASEVLGK